MGPEGGPKPGFLTRLFGEIGEILPEMTENWLILGYFAKTAENTTVFGRFVILIPVLSKRSYGMEINTYCIFTILPSCIFKRIPELRFWPILRPILGQNVLKIGQFWPIFSQNTTKFSGFPGMGPVAEVSLFGEMTLESEDAG